MTDTESNEYAAWIGHTVVDTDGDKVGKVQDVYLDDQTGQPAWMSVKTGLFGGHASFVPFQQASADGDELVIPYSKATVKDAPRVDAEGRPNPQEEAELYRYYERDYAAPANRREAREDRSDDAMTRSEEELRVGAEQTETGRARLRKYVVTENVTTTVPVSHEEVRVEREPITDANRDQAMSGQDITEAEHEMVLHAEQPVVQKEVVPQERVRLTKSTVTGEAEISEQVRKEKIDTEGLGN